MILNELLPMALECGISYHDFLHMTPKIVRMEIEAYWKRNKFEREKTEYQSWLTGYYTIYSIGVNLSKKIKFPKNPLEFEEVEKDISEMDEYELAEKHKAFIERLDLMGRMSSQKENEKES